MRKAELHIHLEGSIGAETLCEIDPTLARDEIEANLTCRSFEEFLRGYIWMVKKLEKPEHYALATRHLLEKLAAEDVTYAEITLSAGVVLWKQQDLSCRVRSRVAGNATVSGEGVLDSRRRAAVRSRTWDGGGEVRGDAAR